MGYCLSCGRLADTINGYCGQCRADEATVRKAAEREHMARERARRRRERGEGAVGK